MSAFFLPTRVHRNFPSAVYRGFLANRRHGHYPCSHPTIICPDNGMPESACMHCPVPKQINQPQTPIPSLLTKATSAVKAIARHAGNCFQKTTPEEQAVRRGNPAKAALSSPDVPARRAAACCGIQDVHADGTVSVK